MLVINNNNVSLKNVIYTTAESRPSKTLLNCDIYKIYNVINKNLNIINELSNIDVQTKPIEYYVLQEIITKLKIFNEYKHSFGLSFNNITINETDNDNIIIFSIEKITTFKSVIINVINLFKMIENNNYLIIDYIDLFKSNSIEFVIILSNLFKKIKIYYCKLLKKNILIGIKYIYNKKTINYIKKILLNLKNNYFVKQFNINVNKQLQLNIYDYNNKIFNYYININNKLSIIEIIEEKEFIFNNFLKVNRIIKNIPNCNHLLIKCYLNDCFICTKCYEYFNIFN